MTVTIGHTILAMPGFGGVRQGDTYLVGRDGGEPLMPYSVEPLVTGATRNPR
jgi:glucose dehydrogenase